MPVSDARVAVIGGGYAGLAAAVSLAEQNIPVTVFEGANTLGGRARRVEHRRLALDNGLHMLMGCYRETLRLICLVGGAARASRTLARFPLELRVADAFHLKVRSLPAPLHLVTALVTAKGLGWQNALAAARFMLNRRRNGFRLERDVSVAELLSRARQPERARRFLWDPLCIATLNTAPERASARVFLNVLRDSLNGAAADCDLVFSRVDLSALFPEPAADFIRARGGAVQTGAPVKAIERKTSGFAVRTVERTAEFSHVVCACDPARAARLLEGHIELKDLRATLSAYRFEPIYSIYLQYSKPVRLPFPLLGLGDAFGQWAFDRGALCGQPGLIGVVISASGPHQALDQDELARTAHRELVRSLGPLPHPDWHWVVAEKRATFACEPDLPRPHQVTPLAGLYLAGDYTAGDYPATLEGAVRSGIQCARHILESR